MREPYASAETQEAPRQGEVRARIQREGQEELHLTIQNDLGELVRVSELANELLECWGAEERVAYATHLALEEVLSNVIRHGYRDGDRHEIEVVLRVRDGVVELEIVDGGCEFDPTRAPEADLHVPLAERRVGGLGIHLLRAFLREIRYERFEGRNFLWLRI